MNLSWCHVETRLGRFTVVAHGGEIVRIMLPGSDADREWARLARSHPSVGAVHEPHEPVLLEAARQIVSYTDRQREQLDLPMRLHGTPFQIKVWQALQQIPPGSVWTYRDVAEAIGRPGAARAVGQANRNNPLPLLIPCHRVVSATGGLGGYMGHEDSRETLKPRLLELEGAGHILTA